MLILPETLKISFDTVYSFVYRLKGSAFRVIINIKHKRIDFYVLSIQSYPPKTHA